MDLAIVIPAYKATYIEHTLFSLSNQTCQKFNVYIGDDNSPEPLGEIVKGYYDRLNLHYWRFKENLGGIDLVAHWERCIDLTDNEKWIWLFSDDDEMEPTCVENFYEAINDKDNDYDIYHYNVRVIDKYGGYVHDKRFIKEDFPQILTSRDFVKKRLRYQLNSFVVEYIFNRNVYNEYGGFHKLDMAWGSDDATWAKLSLNKGIFTIEGPMVKWRYSGDNITSLESSDVMKRKGRAVVKLLSFYDSMFHDSSLYKWFYNYYLHMLYNCMKSCEWSDVKYIILLYKDNFIDVVPRIMWKLVYSIVKK